MKMLISVIKRVRCHFRNKNPHCTYMIGYSAVSEIKSYSDFGTIRSSSNDSLEYISHAVK